MGIAPGAPVMTVTSRDYFFYTRDLYERVAGNNIENTRIDVDTGEYQANIDIAKVENLMARVTGISGLSKGAALYLEPDPARLAVILARALRSLEDYRASFGVDGGTSEVVDTGTPAATSSSSSWSARTCSGTAWRSAGICWKASSD